MSRSNSPKPARAASQRQAVTVSKSSNDYHYSSSSSSEAESDVDSLPEVPIGRPSMRRFSRRPSSPSGLRRYKPMSRSASLTVADFTSQWCEVFRMFDVNLDGVVSCDELASKMRSLGYNVTDSEVQDLVHEWDKDDKGALSLTEFTLMMNSSRFRCDSASSAAGPPASAASGSQRPSATGLAPSGSSSSTSSFLSDGARDTCELLELKAAFDLFDRDKNGLLDPEEVRLALELMGESPTDREVEYIIAEADGDRDGAVSFREFCDIVLGRSLSPRSPFYFHGLTASQAKREEEERRVRLEYQTDHVTARTG